MRPHHHLCSGNPLVWELKRKEIYEILQDVLLTWEECNNHDRDTTVVNIPTKYANVSWENYRWLGLVMPATGNMHCLV